MSPSFLVLSFAVLGCVLAEEPEPAHCKWNDLACQAERAKKLAVKSYDATVDASKKAIGASKSYLAGTGLTACKPTNVTCLVAAVKVAGGDVGKATKQAISDGQAVTKAALDKAGINLCKPTNTTCLSEAVTIATKATIEAAQAAGSAAGSAAKAGTSAVGAYIDKTGITECAPTNYTCLSIAAGAVGDDVYKASSAGVDAVKDRIASAEIAEAPAKRSSVEMQAPMMVLVVVGALAAVVVVKEKLLAAPMV